MKVYLDVCCLNRPFDDQRQDRIRLEAEAVLLILERVQGGQHELVSSDVHGLEIAKATNARRREQIGDLLKLAVQHVTVGKREADHAKELEAMGFGAFDALHLACAEAGAVEVFLTTDDRLLKRAIRHANELFVRVVNPAAWLLEMSL